MKLYKTTGEFTPDSLIADNDFPIMSRGITLAAGQGVLKRGTLIGIVDSKGYVTGEQVGEEKVGVVGILTDDKDTVTDEIATIYISGVFNPAALAAADGVDVKEHEKELRTLGIYFKGVKEY